MKNVCKSIKKSMKNADLEQGNTCVRGLKRIQEPNPRHVYELCFSSRSSNNKGSSHRSKMGG